MNHACPACGSAASEVFFEARALPIHATQVCRTAEQARTLPRGDQRLAVCRACGLVFNESFDPRLLDYSGHHEESQIHSPTFRTFAQDLAIEWVERWRLRGETVVEVGCGGRGEFLRFLKATGVDLAYGFDPGLRVQCLEGMAGVAGERSGIRRSTDTLAAAAVVCRHTLEHIPDVSEFLRTILDAIDPQRCRALLFEVPDFDRVLEEGAFWDLHYEHCSSFTALSLDALFRRAGLDVRDLRRVYGGQYLVIEADPVMGRDQSGSRIEIRSIDAHLQRCRGFADAAAARLKAVERLLDQIDEDKREVAVWGGGAKGSVLLNTLTGTSVRRVVDINPGLQGQYLAGSGVPIVSPAALQASPPDAVLVMNPLYRSEVRQILNDLGLMSVEVMST